MEDEQNNESLEASEDVTYEVIADANVARFFTYELESDDEGFIYDDDGDLLGAVIHFEIFPDHETLTTIFDDLLIKAVMETQDVDEEDAGELIEGCDDEEDFPDELDVSNTFSVLFTVDGHRGIYRCLLDDNDYFIGHSNGIKGDRWDY